MSSLSLYYEDVYGQYYHTQLLYLRKKVNESYALINAGVEDMSIQILPLETKSNFDFAQLIDLEGQRPHIYNPKYRVYYSKIATQNLLGSSTIACSLTQYNNPDIKNILIPYHGFPEFHMQIMDYRPFVLTCVPAGEGRLSYQVRDVNMNHKKIFESETSKTPFSQCGLKSEGDNVLEAKQLYELVFDFCMKKLNITSLTQN
jgi:hypothetical protein